jgi:hypothetical protein
LTGDSIRCFAEICLYRFVVGTDEPEPTTYRRAADHAVSGENVMIVETDSKHAEEWGEFLTFWRGSGYVLLGKIELMHDQSSVEETV